MNIRRVWLRRLAFFLVQLAGHLRHIAAQDRRQVAVDHGGVAAADQLDQRRDFVARRDLRKAEFARERRDALLVVVVAISVHQDDGDGVDAVGLGAFELGAHRIKIERAFHRAVGAHALVDLGDALIEHVRLDDVLGEDFWPGLIADAQRVAKALGDEKERAVALALEQRIGGDRCAHFHRGDAVAWDRVARLEPEQMADAVHRGVAIGLGIFRKQLVRHQRAVRPPPDHVGKGAAAIDPEFPALGRLMRQRLRRGWHECAPFFALRRHDPETGKDILGKDHEGMRNVTIDQWPVGHGHPNLTAQATCAAICRQWS